MITLTYGVIANLTFAQIEDISGFGGISGIVPPSIIGSTDKHAHRLYYLSLSPRSCSTCSCATSSARPSASPCRACATSPCAWARSATASRCTAPSRLRSAFTAAVAACSSCGGTDTSTRDDRPQRDDQRAHHGRHRRAAAHRGRVRRRAAFVFINDRLAETDFSIAGHKLGTFNSLIGIIFLAIVLVSPDGLLGIWELGSACSAPSVPPASPPATNSTSPRRPICQASCPPTQRRRRRESHAFPEAEVCASAGSSRGPARPPRRPRSPRPGAYADQDRPSSRTARASSPPSTAPT